MPGQRSDGCACASSTPASRARTGSSRASTGTSATSASTPRGSPAWPTRGRSSRAGGSTTISTVPTAPSATGRPTRSAPGSRHRAQPLLQRRQTREIKRLADSHNRWTKEWGQVSSDDFERFFADRQQALVRRIERAMGKSVLGGFVASETANQYSDLEEDEPEEEFG